MRTKNAHNTDLKICVFPNESDYYRACIEKDTNQVAKEEFNFLLIPKMWNVKSEFYNDMLFVDFDMAFDRNADSTHENSRSFINKINLSIFLFKTDL